jgi:hypothetical protein
MSAFSNCIAFFTEVNCMTPEEISNSLTEQFGSAVTTLNPESWQVETPEFRLLVLLSEDASWLRLLVPIVPAQDAAPFAEQLLEANFDQTQETRYAFQQGVLWGVFQHSRESLTPADLLAATQRLVELRQRGLDDCFNQLVEVQIRQIIAAAKQQGQSLETTLQTLDRFYEEGIMGGIDAGAAARQENLAAWRWQLERLWDQVDS